MSLLDIAGRANKYPAKFFDHAQGHVRWCISRSAIKSHGSIMKINLPAYTRDFLAELGFLLPLRQSLRNYKASGSRIFVDDSSRRPP
jgi:alpha-D-ribose 1-methylphosphonate 5-triphosphate synthase subunit PhnI